MAPAELDRRWRKTRLSERSRLIAHDVLVGSLTYDEAAANHQVSKQFVHKIIKRLKDNP